MSYGFEIRGPNNKDYGTYISGLYILEVIQFSGQTGTVTKTYSGTPYTNLKVISQGECGTVAVSGTTVTFTSRTGTYAHQSGSFSISLSGIALVCATKRTSEPNGYGIYVTNDSNDIVIEPQLKGLYLYATASIPASGGVSNTPRVESTSYVSCPSRPFVLYTLPSAELRSGTNHQIGRVFSEVQQSGSTWRAQFIQGFNTPGGTAYFFCPEVPAPADYGILVNDSSGNRIFTTELPMLRSSFVNTIATANIPSASTYWSSNTYVHRGNHHQILSVPSATGLVVSYAPNAGSFFEDPHEDANDVALSALCWVNSANQIWTGWGVYQWGGRFRSPGYIATTSTYSDYRTGVGGGSTTGTISAAASTGMIVSYLGEMGV